MKKMSYLLQLIFVLSVFPLSSWADDVRGKTILKNYSFNATNTQLGKELSHHSNNSSSRFDINGTLTDYLPNSLARYYNTQTKQAEKRTSQAPTAGTNEKDTPTHADAQGQANWGGEWSGIRLEGLIWSNRPMYIEPNFGQGYRLGDEEGWASGNGFDCTDSRIHVWDSPEEALADPEGAALEINAKGNDPLDLTYYLGIHYVTSNNDGKYELHTLTYGQEAEYGLHYEFEFVDYYLSGNAISDSRYATFSDWTETESHSTFGIEYDIVKDWNKTPSMTGRVMPRTISPDGFTMTISSITATDREPLVRVMVKNEKGDVLLDGYILLHIQNTPNNLIINDYPVFSKEYKGEPLSMQTTWSQFSRYILANGLSGINKAAFDEWYMADCVEGDTGEYPSENGYQLKIFNFGNDVFGNNPIEPAAGNFNSYWEKRNPFENKALGEALYYPNGEGLNNHTFSWTLSKEEVEMLIKDKTGSVLVTRWICFAAKDSRMAPYPYIWVKLTIEITTAKAQQKFYYGIKNDNYWYHWNPNSNLNNSQVQNGWSALVFDVEAPRDGMTIKDQPWISRISNTLMENYVKIDGKSKYYFAPKVGIDVILPNGAYFYITPENESNHDTYNKLFSQNGEQFDWDEATLEDVLNNNSIIYGGEGAGVFNNDILYAVNISGREYIPIARLIQEQDLSQSKSSASTAGTLELIRYLPIGSTLEDVRAGRAQENTLLYDLLNAVGYPTRDPYKKDYSQCNFDYSMENMHWQLRAWLGYVKDDGNNVAQYVEQGKYDDNNKATFMVSWQRPINAFLLEPLYPVKTEEKYLYLIDHLMLYDWRGGKPNQGYMWDDHYWFWAYYNVKEIDVDLSPYHVKTNLHQEEGEWAYLNQVSTPIQLCPIETKNPGTPAAQVVPGSGDIGIYPFDLLDANMKFTYSYNNSALKKYMGDPNHANDFWQVTNYVQRARFGGIYYNRNGENAKSFSILVPVTVKYEWGSVTTDFQINIENESGSDDNEVITFTTSKGLTYEGNTKTQTATLIGVDSEKTGEVKVPEAVLKDDYSFIVTAIAANAFDGCTQIEKVELPKSIEDFATGALSDCTSLQEIRIIDGGGRFCTVDGVLFSIGNDVLMAYPAAKGNKYEIPTTVTTILDGSFAHAQLTTLTVGWYNPDAIAVDVAAFEGVDFENCELSVPLGMSADYRQHKVWGLFMNVTGKETVIVDGVKYNIKEDGTASFEGPADKSVAGDYVIESPVIFNGVEVPVTEIGDGAFEDCTELTSITIPSTVESIGENAFKGCKNLEDIYCESGVPIDLRKTKRVRTRTGEVITQFDGIDFDKCILYVPIGSKMAYENAEGWNQFKHIVEYDPTGIRDIRLYSNGQDVYYNLQGQRVTNPTKGLYIKNGQKVVVK
jgi:hypothetical protein